MKIGFVVNDLTTETSQYSTTMLACAASKMGHEALFINIGDFAYDPDENIHAHAHCAVDAKYADSAEYLNAVQGKQAISRYINVSHLDALLLRNNPADDARTRPWARQAGINFGRFAAKCGVLVLNDPEGLSNASNKLYLQQFPRSVRPRCLISRDQKQIEAFAKSEGGTVVIKPLFGSGGRNVFLLRPDGPNVHQMIETVARDGYVIAQEYLPGAAKGDTRLFLLNGQPLQRDGKIAAIRRVRSNTDSDIRSNITAGARSVQAIVDDKMLAIVDAVAPRLKHDGMFLVGLDIVGRKLMEINVFSPGGLNSAEHFEQVNFSQTIIQDVERKVNMKRNSQFMMRNRELAVL